MKTIVTILTALLMSFNSFADSKSSGNPMPELLEGEYGVDTDNNDNNWSGKPDGDLDVYIDRTSSKAPIEFSMDIPVDPTNQAATLVMNIWDVDAHCDSSLQGCEVDEVYVNNVKVGVLNGKNDEWSRNRFMIPENTLKQGSNNVEIRINTLKVENWAVELNWAYITGLSVDPNKLSISRCWVAPKEVRPGDYVNFFAKVRGNPESVNVYNGDLRVLNITDPHGDGV